MLVMHVLLQNEFAESFTSALPTSEQFSFVEESRPMRPNLCDADGKWTADYVRLLGKHDELNLHPSLTLPLASQSIHHSCSTPGNGCFVSGTCYLPIDGGGAVGIVS